MGQLVAILRSNLFHLPLHHLRRPVILWSLYSQSAQGSCYSGHLLYVPSVDMIFIWSKRERERERVKITERKSHMCLRPYLSKRGGCCWLGSIWSMMCTHLRRTMILGRCSSDWRRRDLLINPALFALRILDYRKIAGCLVASTYSIWIVLITGSENTRTVLSVRRSSLTHSNSDSMRMNSWIHLK